MQMVQDAGVTPEMVRVGSAVLEEHGRFQDREALVRMVYSAMQEARAKGA